MVQVTTERIEALVPEAFVARDPGGRGLHGRGIELAAHDAARLGACDQAGRLEHGEVLHEAGQRHAVRLRELAHRGAAGAELLEHAAPRGVGERGEHEVEAAVLTVNHGVKYLGAGGPLSSAV